MINLPHLQTRYLPYACFSRNAVYYSVAPLHGTQTSQYNDPYLNRFQQPDSIVPGAGNPQAFNRYSYVVNRPLTLIDPTGHMSCDVNLTGNGPVSEDDCIDAGGNIDYGPDPGLNYLDKMDLINQLAEESTEYCAEYPTTPDCYDPDFTYLAEYCSSYPSGCPQYAANSDSEDTELDNSLWFFENIAFKLNDLVEAYDIYNLSGTKWYRATRASLPLGIVEAGVAGLRQIHRDSWWTSYTPGQRITRPLVVAAETLLTDYVAGNVGSKLAFSGSTVGGPFGAAGAYLAASTVTTRTMDRMWLRFNQKFLNFLGAWP